METAYHNTNPDESFEKWFEREFSQTGAQTDFTEGLERSGAHDVWIHSFYQLSAQTARCCGRKSNSHQAGEFQDTFPYQESDWNKENRALFP